MATSVLPSVTTRIDPWGFARRASASQPFLGYSSPGFAENAFAGQRGGAWSFQDALKVCPCAGWIELDRLRNVPRLRKTAQDRAQIAHTLGVNPERGAVILGAQAAKRKVTSTDLRRYPVLRFATHGLLPRELRRQAEPALPLTPPTASSAEENGRLDASDIAQPCRLTARPRGSRTCERLGTRIVSPVSRRL